LGGYIRQTVQELTRDKARTQDAAMDADPAQPIVFRAAPTPAPDGPRARPEPPAPPAWRVVIRFPADFTGGVELLGGDLTIIQTWAPAQGSRQIDLGRGYYGVRPVGADDGRGVFAANGLFTVAAADVDVQL